MLTYLQTTYVLVSLILASFGGISGLVIWLHRRMRVVASDVARESSSVQVAVVARMDVIECDVRNMAADIKEIRSEQGRSEARLTGVERIVANLASREDLHELTIVMTRFEGRMNGVDQQLRGISIFTERFQDWLLEQSR